MTKAGIPPRQIFSSLRQKTPNLPAISRTIYNVKKKIRKENLGNRPMINALFEELEEGGFTYDISHNSEEHISRLFIAHPLSIKLVKAFSNIFVMDCTYKTNKYNMSLLDITEKEDEENYAWALRAFKEIIGQGDLREVKEKICLAVEHEFNEIKVKLSSEKLQVPHYCNMPFFRELHSHISHFALKEIYRQYDVAKDGIITLCTGHFMTTMGLPCAHKIKYWQGTTFSLDLIHPHRRIDTLSLNVQNDLHGEGIDRFDELLNELHSTYQRWPLNKKEHALSVITKLVNQSVTVFEPVIQRPKGRPPKSKKEKRNNFHNTRSFKI
ncbi:uncharacterized protein LOC111901587 [Lactuca sativa]|uniref:uncharacterized protein LOC111901587 n=1 Tax=Lactuca sativa TaxID=4236 RepID=UPI0022AE6AD3|nr:uncharacterized protein LOC111901587 [Lactuca sativa]